MTLGIISTLVQKFSCPLNRQLNYTLCSSSLLQKSLIVLRDKKNPKQGWQFYYFNASFLQNVWKPAENSHVSLGWFSTTSAYSISIKYELVQPSRLPPAPPAPFHSLLPQGSPHPEPSAWNTLPSSLRSHAELPSKIMASWSTCLSFRRSSLHCYITNKVQHSIL